MNIAVFPSDHTEELSDALAFSTTQTVSLVELSPEAGGLDTCDVLVVEITQPAMRVLREIGRIEETLGVPVLVITTPDQLALIEADSVGTDFLVSPVNPVELRLRLHRMLTVASTDEIIRFKDLELNPLTYQASLAGGPMDLTFMEYELLRFLVENPVRVWSREQLLSRVWGYEYYGGARTVDVHVRRLRSKLGEERASWITTVRSVGYRWG